MARRGRMAVHAERALVAPGDEGGDRLALAATQRGVADQQYVGELREGLARFRPEGEEATNAREMLGDWNVRHENAS